MIVAILTDGYENSSEKFTWKDISRNILKQTNTYKWQFLFLGANQDAISTAANLSIAAANASSYATARNSCQAIGCIRSPSGHDCSLAREVAGTKIGPHGGIRTRTCPILSRMPLLLGYMGKMAEGGGHAPQAGFPARSH